MEFDGYRNIALFMVAIEAAIILIIYRRNPKIALYITLISIVLKGQFFWFFKPLYAWHISALLGLFLAIFSKKRMRSVSVGRILSAYKSGILLFFTYCYAISVPMWAFFSSEAIDGFGNAVTLTRVMTQIIFMLLLLGIFWFGIDAGRFAKVWDVLRMIVVFSTVTAYFAIIQFIVFYQTGINIFPILGSDDTTRSAYILETNFRATSFAGEPKHLGILMSIGLTSFFITRIFRVHFGRYSFHIPLVMAAALVLSLSTTGIYLSVCGTVLLSLVFFSRLPKTDLLFIAVLIFILLFFIQPVWFERSFLSALESQSSKFEFEVQDRSVLYSLLDKPLFAILGSGLGNIHILAVDYLPEDFPLFRDQGYKSNSGLFFVLGDSGLVGFLLLLVSHFFSLIAYIRDRNFYSLHDRSEALATLALLFVSLSIFILRFNELLFLVSGFSYTRLASLRQQSFSTFRT